MGYEYFYQNIAEWLLLSMLISTDSPLQIFNFRQFIFLIFLSMQPLVGGANSTTMLVLFVGLLCWGICTVGRTDLPASVSFVLRCDSRLSCWSYASKISLEGLRQRSFVHWRGPPRQHKRRKLKPSTPRCPPDHEGRTREQASLRRGEPSGLVCVVRRGWCQTTGAQHCSFFMRSWKSY